MQVISTFASFAVLCAFALSISRDYFLPDATLRVTWQASKKNKLAFHYDRSIKWRGHRPNNWLTASINDPISDVVQTTQQNLIGEVKWTGMPTPHVLTEASVFVLPVNYTLGFEPDAAPDAIATGNVGCIRQLTSRAGPPVVHTVELLDWATGGPVPLALRERIGERS